MKSNTGKCSTQKSVSCSPLLFTPTQHSSKKRKLCNDDSSSKKSRIIKPSTPGLQGTLKSPGLPESAHGYKKTKDDSYLLELLKSGSVGRSSRSSSFQQNKSHWLFDTPCAFRESPQVRKKQGVSRRSLDRLLDPELPFVWLESMATPPSDTSEKYVKLPGSSGEKEKVLSPAIACASRGSHKDNLSSSRTNDKIELNYPPKRTVARVLFDKLKEHGLESTTETAGAEMQLGENIEPLGSSIDEGIMCRQIIITSDEDERRCLSPTVVRRQDRTIVNKEREFVDNTKGPNIEIASPKKGVLAPAESLLYIGSCEENTKGFPPAKKDLAPSEILQCSGPCGENTKEPPTLNRGIWPIEGRVFMTSCDEISEELPLKMVKTSIDCNLDTSVTDKFEASISDMMSSPPVVSKSDKWIDMSRIHPIHTNLRLPQEETLANESPKIISRMKTKRRRKSHKETKRKKLNKPEIEITFAKNKGNLERINIVPKEDMPSDFNQHGESPAHKTTHLPGLDKPSSPGLAETTCVEYEANSKFPDLKDVASRVDENQADDNSSRMFSISNVQEIPDISDYCQHASSICKSPGLDRPVKTSRKLYDNASEDCNKNKRSNETFTLSRLKLGCNVSDYDMVSDDVSIVPKSPCLSSVPKTLCKSDIDSTGSKTLICDDALFSPIRLECDNTSYFLSQFKHFDSDASDLSDLAPMSPAVVSNPEKKDADSCVKLIESTPKAPRATATEDGTNPNNTGEECPMSLAVLDSDKNSARQLSCKIGNSRSYSRNDGVDNFSDEGDYSLSPSVVKTEDLRNLDQLYPKVDAVLKGDSTRANTRAFESRFSQTNSKRDRSERVKGENIRLGKLQIDSLLHLHTANNVVKNSKQSISSTRPDGMSGEKIKDVIGMSKENKKKEHTGPKTDKHRFANKGISLRGDYLSTVEPVTELQAGESSSVVHAIIRILVNTSVAKATERLSCPTNGTSNKALYQSPTNHPSIRLSDSLLSPSSVIPCTPVQQRKSNCFRLRNSVRIGRGKIEQGSNRVVSRSSSPGDCAMENVLVHLKTESDKADCVTAGTDNPIGTSNINDHKVDLSSRRTVCSTSGPNYGIVEESIGSSIQLKIDSNKLSDQTLVSFVSAEDDLLHGNALGTCSAELELPEPESGMFATKESSDGDRNRKIVSKPSHPTCSVSRMDDQVLMLSQGDRTSVEHNVAESFNAKHLNTLKCRNSAETICDVKQREIGIGATKNSSAIEADSNKYEGSYIIPGDSLLEGASELEDNKENESERSTFGDKKTTRCYHPTKETEPTQVKSGKGENNLIDMDSLTQFPFEDLEIRPPRLTNLQTANNDTKTASNKDLAAEMIPNNSGSGAVFKDTSEVDGRKIFNKPKQGVKTMQPIKTRSYSSDSSAGDILDDLMFGTKEKSCIERKNNKEPVHGIVSAKQVVIGNAESNLEAIHVESNVAANSKQAVQGAHDGYFGEKNVIAAATSCLPALNSALTLKTGEKSEGCNFGVFKGFTTGSGKPLKASDDALKAAKKLVADFDRDEVGSGFAIARNDGVRKLDTAIHRTYDLEKKAPKPVSTQCWNDTAFSNEFESDGIKLCHDKIVERRKDLSNKMELEAKLEVDCAGVKLYDGEILNQRKDLSNEMESEKKLEVDSDGVKLYDDKIIDRRIDVSNNIESESQSDFALGDSLVPVSDDSELNESTCNVNKLNKLQDKGLEHEEEALLSLLNSSFDIDDFTQLRDDIPKPIHIKPTISKGALEKNCSTTSGTVPGQSSCENPATIKRKPESSNGRIAENSRLKPLSYRKQRFAGFSTGAGKMTEVSKDAIEAAKNKLTASEDPSRLNPDNSKQEKFMGFSTGTGKRIPVSNEAIERPRRRLESNEELDQVGSRDRKQTKFTGFSTGSGKKIEVSKEAIERAKNRLGTEEELGQVGCFGREATELSGFSTGSGKKVKVSKEAIERAKKRLGTDEEVDQIVSYQGKEATYAGFSTGLGKKIEVSKEAIEKAKKRLGADEELGEDGSFDRKEVKFTGFSTGSGKKVEVSKEAIKRAKKRLGAAEELGEDGSFDRKEVKFTGFRTGSGKKVEVSKKAIEKAKKRLGADEELGEVGSFDIKEVKFTGFSTGSGKKVEVSREAIEKAKTRLGADEELGEVGSFDIKEVKFTGFSTGSGKKVEVSKEAIERAKKRLGADEEVDQIVSCQGKETTFTGFNTGSGKKIEVSKEAIEKAKKRLGADEEVDNIGSCQGKETKFTGFNTGSRKKIEVSKEAIERAKKRLGADEEKFAGFSTGSGKKVEVSKEAIEKAKKTLGADEQVDEMGSCLEKETNFTGFNTGSGKKIEVSKEAIERAKKRLGADEEKFAGFSTGSGKKVEVSKEAIEKAKKTLGADEQIDEMGSCQEKETNFTGFNTGSGKKIEVSKEAIERAKKRIPGDEELEAAASCDGKEANFTGFCTGSGKKIEVSKEAIERARKRIPGDEELEAAASCDGKNAKFTGFCTGSGKKIEVSKEAIEAVKRQLETSLEDKIVDFPAKESEIFTGFSTGAGKRVVVSEQALKAAKKTLESDGELLQHSKTEICSNIGLNDFRADTHSGVKTEETLFDPNRTPKLDETLDRNNSNPKKRLSLNRYAGKRPQRVTETHHGGKRFIDDGDDNAVGKREFKRTMESESSKSAQHDVATDDDVIEMSERFDHDVNKEMEEDPQLLSTITRNIDAANCRSDSMVIGRKMAAKVQAKFEKDITQDDQLMVKRRKSLGMNRKSSFNFAIKSSNPAEYHSDRNAKYTIPLIPKISRTNDARTPDLSRFGSGRPASMPKLSSMSSTRTPVSSGDHTNTKSFSTPFKPGNRNANEENLRYQGKKKNGLKRPLFACVPFGKRQKIEEKMVTTNDSIKPQPGRLYQMKQSVKQKPRLSEITLGQQPGTYTREELQDFGIDDTVIDVTSENAGEFMFSPDFFSDAALESKQTTIGDGANLCLSEEGNAGPREFQSAFLTISGIDKSLINEDWVFNQYRWIIWKLSCMERSFPEQFAGRCLTPNEVMFQLKYRYDREIDKAERSAIKKILERDDVSTSRLVLCVSRVFPASSRQHIEQEASDSNRKGQQQPESGKRTIEMTDGWYPIRAILDKPLSSLLLSNKIQIGAKLCIYGANLTGSDQAAPPLEVPESVSLELNANSTRRAHWNAKLGFQNDRRAFPVPVYSLFADGGPVGCIDVVIQRIYPTQWMEKSQSGCIFRNSSQEQIAARKYENQKQIKMEKIYNKIQKEFENSQNSQERRRSRRKSRAPPLKDLVNIRNGQELFDIFESANDPGSLELALSESQKEMLDTYRRQRDDEQRSLIQKRFEDAWKEVQEEFPERVVISLQKFKVTDHKLYNGKQKTDSYLTVWKPTEDINAAWKEGTRLKIYNLSTSASRYKHTMAMVQLATMKSTRYDIIDSDPDKVADVFKPREVLSFSKLKETGSRQSDEIDVGGYVVHIEDHGSHSELQTVYLADLSEVFLAVKVWGGLKAFHLEELLTHGSLVCIKNLIFKPEPSSMVTATFNDLSVVYKNPKDVYLKVALDEIKQNNQNVTEYLDERREHLQEKLRSGSRGVRLGNTPRSNGNSFITTPSRSASNTPTSSSLVLTKNTTAVLRKPYSCETPVRPNSHGNSCKIATPQTAVKDSIELNAQRRLNEKKMNALSRYGELPAVSPLPASMTPNTRKGFRPPSMKRR